MTDSSCEHSTKVVIIGGSIGGLCAGLALHAAGCDVEIHERSTGDRPSRGSGVVVRNEMEVFLEHYGIPVSASIGVPSWIRQRIDLDGNMLDREAAFTRYESWDALHQRLRAAFPEERYHTGSRPTGIGDSDGGVRARFADGREIDCDLLVGADGIGSTCRAILLPEAVPEYAGYVAWHGTIAEEALPLRTVKALGEKHTLYQGYGMQMVAFMIPGTDGDTTPGNRRMDWSWYVKTPEGDAPASLMTDSHGAVHERGVHGNIPDELRERQLQMARALLPPAFLDLFERTGDMSIMKVVDLGVPAMAFGQACLIGDAAFTLRPQTSSGTAKALADALTLAERIAEHPGDVPAALAAWEPGRIADGRRLQLWGRALDDRARSPR